MERETGVAGRERRTERLADWAPAMAILLFHLAFLRGYGVFRDELYYMACGRRPGWGYVDHPPLVAWVAWLVARVAGESHLALRVVAALAMAATVFLAGRIAAALGGGPFARALAGLATGLAPVVLSLASIYSMNVFDLLFWALIGWILARALSGGPERLWLAFGLVAGVGLLNKISILYLGFGLVVGLVLARRWDVFRSRLLLGGRGPGLRHLPAPPPLAARPRLADARVHGERPPGEDGAALGAGLREGGAPPDGAFGLALGPRRGVAPPVPEGGAMARPRLRVPRRARGARVRRRQAVLPRGGLLAGVRRRRGGRGSRYGRTRTRPPPDPRLLMVGVGLAVSPLGRPVLPVDAFVRYAEALGQKPGTDERQALGRLPQFYADMHGWRAMAEAVAGVVRTLSAEDRARACVFGQNYGEAGAVEYFARELDLPPAISGHNSYWLWGPGRCTGEVIVAIGSRRERLDELFADVRLAGVTRCADCMPYENGRSIWIARGPKRSLLEIWPRVKGFI